MRRLVAALALLLVAPACGEGAKVGSEKLTTGFATQKPGERLGALETEQPVAGSTPAPLGVQVRTPEPTASPTPTPAPRYFDVSLTADSPFYEPGNAIVILQGVTLRVTNRDGTPERTSRSFTDEAGSFDSEMLKPGQTWTHTFDHPARFTVIDRGLTFARATLEVQ